MEADEEPTQEQIYKKWKRDQVAKRKGLRKQAVHNSSEWAKSIRDFRKLNKNKDGNNITYAAAAKLIQINLEKQAQ